jgi:hypothetical protein
MIVSALKGPFLSSAKELVELSFSGHANSAMHPNGANLADFDDGDDA